VYEHQGQEMLALRLHVAAAEARTASDVPEVQQCTVGQAEGRGEMKTLPWRAAFKAAKQGFTDRLRLLDCMTTAVFVSAGTFVVLAWQAHSNWAKAAFAAAALFSLVVGIRGILLIRRESRN
jgi:hypothetical protein